MPVVTETECTDADLLDRFCRAGDEAAFRQILIRHEGWVRHHCQLRLGRHQDADDATQAVFVLLARKATSIRNGQALAAWLQRATHGVTANMLNAARARRTHERAAGEQLPVHGEEDDGDDELIRAGRHLPACLDELQPTDREVVIRYYIKCQKLTEIAHELGSTPGAIQKRVSRAIDKLQTLMRRSGVVVAPALLMAIASPGRAATPSHRLSAIMNQVGTTSASTSTAAMATGLGMACLAVIVVAGWAAGWLPIGAPTNASLRLTVVPEQGTVNWQDTALQAGPTVLTNPGSLTTSAHGGALLSGTFGTITLRETSQVSVTANSLRLDHGALIIKSDQPTSITLPRMGITCSGTVRILSADTFDRFDVVDGSVTLTDGRVITSGQAFSQGLDCPSEPFAASLQEISPRHGGLFYRSIAPIYDRGSMVLLEPITFSTVFDPDLAAVAQAYPGSLQSKPGGTDDSTMHLRHPGGTKQPLGFSLIIPEWPVIQATQITMTVNSRTSIKGIEYNDGGEGEALSAMPWMPTSLTSGPKYADLPTMHRGRPVPIIQTSAPVGQTPDGRIIWEKHIQADTRKHDVTPYLMVGSGPVTATVFIPAGALLEVSELTAAVGELPR